MELKVIRYEKNVFEFELEGTDETVPQLLVGRLTGNSSVEFASYVKGHPLMDSVKVMIRTKGKDPKELVAKELEKIADDVKEFKKGFKEAARKA